LDGIGTGVHTATYAVTGKCAVWSLDSSGWRCSKVISHVNRRAAGVFEAKSPERGLRGLLGAAAAVLGDEIPSNCRTQIFTAATIGVLDLFESVRGVPWSVSARGDAGAFVLLKSGGIRSFTRFEADMNGITFCFFLLVKRASFHPTQ
jgi:hypothetical protein